MGTAMLASVLFEDGGLGPSGWLAVVGYGAVTWLCLRAFMVEKSGPPRPYRQAIPALWRVLRKHWPDPPAPARRAAVWLLVASLMIGLGLDRVFDLETQLLDLWRVESRKDGTYVDRRSVQAGFICMVAIVMGLVGAGIARVARGQWSDLRLVLGGALCLLTFVTIRAASLHAVDEVLRTRVMGAQLSGALELVGIAVVGAAAARRWWPRRPGAASERSKTRPTASRPGASSDGSRSPTGGAARSTSGASRSWLGGASGSTSRGASGSTSRGAGASGSSAGASTSRGAGASGSSASASTSRGAGSRGPSARASASRASAPPRDPDDDPPITITQLK